MLSSFFGNVNNAIRILLLSFCWFLWKIIPNMCVCVCAYMWNCVLTRKHALTSGLDLTKKECKKKKKFHGVDVYINTCTNTWNAQLPLYEYAKPYPNQLGVTYRMQCDLSRQNIVLTNSFKPHISTLSKWAGWRGGGAYCEPGWSSHCTGNLLSCLCFIKLANKEQPHDPKIWWRQSEETMIEVHFYTGTATNI